VHAGHIFQTPSCVHCPQITKGLDPGVRWDDHMSMLRMWFAAQ